MKKIWTPPIGLGDLVYWVRDGRPRVLATVMAVDGDRLRLRPVLQQWTAGRQVTVNLNEVQRR